MGDAQRVVTDLSSFDDVVKVQEEGYDLDILHPISGEAIGITIRIAGPDSARARRAANRSINESMRAQRLKRPTAEDAYARSLQHLAGLVVEWSGVMLDGQELPPSNENCLLVFTRFPWIANQVDVAANDRSLFTRA